MAFTVLPALPDVVNLEALLVLLAESALVEGLPSLLRASPLVGVPEALVALVVAPLVALLLSLIHI